MQSFGRSPAQMSDLATKGKSLDTREVNCQGGVLSYIDDYLRPSTKAKKMRNLHQFSRGVFSSGGGGWKRDCQNGINGGTARTLDFGTYLDALGNQFLLTQIGNTVFNYDTVAHNATSIAGLTALDPLTVPCIRPAAPTATTTTPFSIYCNGLIEPLKVYNATAGAAPNTVATLGFNSGRNSTTITVGGTITTGAVVQLIVFGATLGISPSAVTYTVKVGDTATQVATGLATALNTNAFIGTAGIVATSSGTIINVTYPSTATFAFSTTIATETVLVGGAVGLNNQLNVTISATGIPGGSVTATATESGADTTSTAATKLAAAINASSAVNVGVSAIAQGPYVTIAYPSQSTITFGQSTTGGATLTLSVGLIETATITGTPLLNDGIQTSFTSAGITGSPITVTYVQQTGDTINTVAASHAAAINAVANLNNAGFYAQAGGNVITISYPTSLAPSPTFGVGGTAGVTETLVAGQSVSAVTLTIATGNTTQTFPGLFGGLTYTKPALCSPFQTRVAYAGFANTGASGNAVCQMLLISGQGNAEAFPSSAPAKSTDAWSIPIPPICGAVTALRSLKLNTNQSSEVLLVGCQNGFCVVSGTDATNFNLQIQSLSFGIPSNRAMVPLDNAMIFLATDGFRMYSGQNNTTNLLTESISLDIYDQFLLIDRTNWKYSHAVHHRDTQEVWFWVPYIGDAGIPQHAFILNYNSIDGQPIWYNVDNTSCTASVEFQQTMYGGNELGIVQRWYGVNNYDDIAGNVSQETVTVGGAAINGNVSSVTFTASSIAGSPITASYTQKGTDTTALVAAGIAAAINATTALTGAGISAIAVANVVTISYPTGLTVAFGQTSVGATLTLAALANTSNATNILPNSELVLAVIGVGNIAQFCSIHEVVICTSANDQRFLINASAYEEMDDGSTRKQQMQPINYALQSITQPQTVLGPNSPNAWTLNNSAFPQQSSKFLAGYVPMGHARLWEFSIVCNDSSHNLDFTSLQSTISIGGMRV